jgi:hypothetical protein
MAMLAASLPDPVERHPGRADRLSVFVMALSLPDSGSSRMPPVYQSFFL